MMRHASIEDFQFIFSLILEEAKNGHFSPALLIPAATRGFDVEVKSVLSHRVRIDDTLAYALIWEKDSMPVGFIIMSAGPDNKGNELWMAAISLKLRGQGEGGKMIDSILNQFQGRNLSLFARCAPQSERMFQMLLTRGFKQASVGKQGMRGLIYTL